MVRQLEDVQDPTSLVAETHRQKGLTISGEIIKKTRVSFLLLYCVALVRLRLSMFHLPLLHPPPVIPVLDCVLTVFMLYYIYFLSTLFLLLILVSSTVHNDTSGMH